MPTTSKSFLDELFADADPLPDPLEMPPTLQQSIDLRKHEEGALQAGTQFQEGTLTGDPLNPVIQSFRNERYMVDPSRLTAPPREDAEPDEPSDVSVSPNTIVLNHNVRIGTLSGSPWLLVDNVTVGLQMSGGVISLVEVDRATVGVVQLEECDD